MPAVSVITPIYNGARYLPAAIDSLLAQTFTDWELIAVDDGSTDETPAILQRYGDGRIRTVWQPNGGEAAARNRGLSMVRGEFVAFLDADDLYLPNALADLAGFLRQQPHYDVAFSDGYVCDENGMTLTRLSQHRPGIHQGRILEFLILDASVITVPVCTLTRRTAIQRSQAQFDTRLIIGPDWDFWIHLARTAAFGYLDALTCRYRIHLSNITRLSGQRRRRADLIAGRLKILGSPWFADLSLATRKRFLQDLLLQLLSADPVRQRRVLHDPACEVLPRTDQADLWRRVAIDQILHGDESGFAAECLRRGLTLHPTDRKSLALTQLVAVPGGRFVAPALLQAWSRTHAGVVRLFQPHPRPKAVPSALRPVGE